MGPIPRYTKLRPVAVVGRIGAAGVWYVPERSPAGPGRVIYIFFQRKAQRATPAPEDDERNQTDPNGGHNRVLLLT